ncbi:MULTISPECIES: ligase-associated DNA damage response exonuclease [Sphingobacterium]|uniref:Ligase-associated DNA damage response exonuclease n=1 Tax=Sphingobacterium populi TaxID=1812824 RepID=A0ABW5UF26_9SPHI|nr:ligase-associated DNA damage response exonuclease [Sphingobacterium sp. CFCC 11742]
MLTFTDKGIYCEPGKFYIDPWRPVDYAIITHGHADHAKWGMKNYLCHHYTVPILQSRIGADIAVQGVEYHEVISRNGVKISLHPAGHIIGSAQIRIEYKGKVSVVSGDYKIQEDGLSTPFEPVKCHEFVTESTFGLPIYRWQPIATQNHQLQQWVQHNQAQQKTSVFVGYSLGKAQRIMQALEEAGPLYVHYSIGKLNRAFEQIGVRLPKYEIVDLREDVKHLDQGIVIVPPSLLESKVIKKIPHMAHAICSGWMQVRGARRWRSADAGFPISDHADWEGLIEAVKATGAEQVHVTHGQTAVFAKYLNEIGIAADVVPTEYGQEEEEDSPEHKEVQS